RSSKIFYIHKYIQCLLISIMLVDERLSSIHIFLCHFAITCHLENIPISTFLEFYQIRFLLYCLFLFFIPFSPKSNTIHMQKKYKNNQNKEGLQMLLFRSYD